MNKVLSSVKLLLGIPAEVKDFDEQLVMHINSVLTTLNQLGYEPYQVTTTEGDLEDFVEDEIIRGMVQVYISNKVRILFDPPSSAFVLASLERIIDENEWRLREHITTKE